MRHLISKGTITSVGSKKKKMLKTLIANKYIYFMLIPVAVYYIVFHYIPMYGLVLAFKTFESGGLFNMLFGGEYVGLQYFRQIFSSPLFFRAVKNTITLSSMKLGILFPFTIFLVLMINELRSLSLKKLSQTIMYLPHFFSWVVIGGIVIQLLSVNGGSVAGLIAHLNKGEQVSLLTSKEAFRWILLISSAFKEMGWSTIVYLAALTSIPAELYEAAEVDGAKRFQKIWRITLPEIMPTISIMLLLNISFMMNGDFDQVYILYNTSVYEVADIIETYMYRTGLTNGNFGMATAMGLVKSLISMTLLISSNKMCKKISGESIY